MLAAEFPAKTTAKHKGKQNLDQNKTLFGEQVKIYNKQFSRSIKQSFTVYFRQCKIYKCLIAEKQIN